MDDFEVKAIRVWMRSIMDTKDWSANKWATLSGTSPTNITRFLNGSKFVPSSKTIAKLAAVAGSSPDLGGTDLMNLSSQALPLLAAEDDQVVGQVTVYNVKGDLLAYRFDRDLIHYGIGKGDTLVVRKQTKFDTGDLLIHSWKDNNHPDRVENTTLGLGIKIKGHNEIWKTRRRITVSFNHIILIGKVIQIIKDLEQPVGSNFYSSTTHPPASI